MLKPENLIIDEIYYKNDFIFKHVETSPYKCNNTALDIKNKRLYKDNAAMDTYNKSPERLATNEEKAWLNHCIKEDKFVEYEEFMKVYKSQFIVGKWYKYKDWYIKFKKECSNGYFHSSEEIDNNKIYRKTSSCFGECNNEKILLEDLSKIQEFLPQDHPDKQLDIKQIQEECKKRFPIGCKFRCANDIRKQHTLIQDEIVYEINDSYIYASGGQGCLYYKGKYAELIETPEVISPEYVECVIEDSCIKIGKIYQVDKNLGFKYADDIKPVYYLVENYRTPYYQSHFRPSTKSAYDLQNLKQQPLTPEQCYNTEIEVGDEVECVEGIGTTGMGFNLGLKFIVNDIQNYKPEKCYFGGDRGHGVYENHLKLIKKANKNTTTTLNKKVDVSSPKVTDRLRLKVRNQTTVVNTEERIKLKLNHLKTIKIKQNGN